MIQGHSGRLGELMLPFLLCCGTRESWWWYLGGGEKIMTDKLGTWLLIESHMKMLLLGRTVRINSISLALIKITFGLPISVESRHTHSKKTAIKNVIDQRRSYRDSNSGPRNDYERIA